MRTKRSTLAGAWYPADAVELSEQVDGFLMRPETRVPDPTAVCGVVVPHAGYRYSGAVAGHAYACLRGQSFTRVVIIAPSHRVRFRGAAVIDAAAFATPLGVVDIDPAAADLCGRRLVQRNSAPFEAEHALEIQLPFLQRSLPGARVVPLLLGELAADDHETLAATLDSLADEATAFVVSSDFTHYGARFDYLPFPADDPQRVGARLCELDMGAIEPILRCDPSAFQRYLDATGATVCGRGAIRTFITRAGLHAPGHLLAYQTSLDVTGDYEHCVSYAAIAFPRRAAPRR